MRVHACVARAAQARAPRGALPHRTSVSSSPSEKPRPVTGRDLSAGLREVPVFPLPQAVLFPGARMPLHIFEPRYRRMTRDALDTHRLIAVAHIANPVQLDARGQPEIAAVAGVGAIVGVVGLLLPASVPLSSPASEPGAARAKPGASIVFGLGSIGVVGAF